MLNILLTCYFLVYVLLIEFNDAILKSVVASFLVESYGRCSEHRAVPVNEVISLLLG